MPSFTRPTKFPEWASGGSADITEPTAGEKATGWANLQKPGHDVFNWWQELAYEWLQYFDVKQPQAFATLQDAVTTMSAGEVGVVNEWPANFDQEDTDRRTEVLVGAASSAVNRVVCDGEYVYISYEQDGNEYVRGYTRGVGAGALTVLWTYTATATVNAMCAEGNGVYIEDNNFIKKLNRLTGVTDATFTPFNYGAAVHDLACNGVELWYIGGSGQGQLNPTTGASINTFTLGGAAYGGNGHIALRGEWGYVGHVNGAGNDLHKVKSGNGVPTYSVNVGFNQWLCLLDNSLLVNTAANAYDVLDLYDLSITLSTGTLPGAVASPKYKAVAYDGRYVVFVDNVWKLWCLDPTAMNSTAIPPVYATSFAAGGTNGVEIAADCSAVFLTTSDTAFDVYIHKLHTCKKPHLVRRCSATDGWRTPFQQLVIPCHY